MWEVNSDFTVPQLMTEAWQKVKGSKGRFWKALIVTIVFTFIFLIFSGFIGKQLSPLKSFFSITIFWFFYLLSKLVQNILSAGVLYMGIQRARNLPIEFRMMFRGLFSPFLWRIIQLSCIYFLVIFLPFYWFVAGKIYPYIGIKISFGLHLVTAFLIAIALIYFFIRSFLSLFLVIDKGLQPVAALKISFEATRGKTAKILGLLLLLLLISLFCIFSLGLGYIWFLPFIIICYGELYRHLIDSNPTLLEKNMEGLHVK